MPQKRDSAGERSGLKTWVTVYAFSARGARESFRISEVIRHDFSGRHYTVRAQVETPKVTEARNNLRAFNAR